jgi:hypothetical protein
MRPGSINLDVAPPAGMQHRGVGGVNLSPQMGNAAALIPGNTIKGLLAGGMSTTGASPTGFNWKTHNGGVEHNDVLAGMLEGSGAVDSDTIEYYIGKVEEPMVKFLYYMSRRETAVFYKNYQQVKEQFVLDQQTGYPCPLKKEFIADVNKIATFHHTIAMQGTVIFGYLLIEEMRRSNKEQWTEQDFNNAVQLACYHVLFLELLNWLFNTKKGLSFNHRLPKTLEQQLANLDGIKEQFSKMWETFDAPFPYANLNFVSHISTPVEYARVYDPNNYAEYLGFVPQQARTEVYQTEDHNSLTAMIKRNAAAYHGYKVNQEPPRKPAANHNVSNEVGMTWGTIRNDLQNLDRNNMREFDLPRYFRPTGRPNHYFIPESDWRQIQRVFQRHPEMRQEEALMHGCFRIVVIDLQADNGWFSHVVRAENLDVTRVLTNPALLLPLLDKPDNDNDAYMVIAAPLAEVAKDDKLEVPVESVKALGEGIPAIVIDEPIVEKESVAIINNVNLITSRVTSKFKDTSAAVFDNLTEWNTYECASAEDKERLFLDAPFVFADSQLTVADRPSFYEAAKKLKNLFREGVLDNGLCTFINGRLTEICNQWLANECGYNVVDGKGGGGKLQIDNLAADIDDLYNELHKNDETAFNVFVGIKPDSYLNRHLQLFHKANPHLVPREEMGALDKLKDDVNLYVIRSFYMANVVGNKGPYYEEVNVPQYIKRSTFPEIFRLMEIVVEDQDQDVLQDEIYRDKLIRFSGSNNVWLFSYTLGDRNVATLRHVDTQKALVLLGLN